MKKGIKSRVAAAVTAVAMVLGGVGLTAPKMSKAAGETDDVSSVNYSTIVGSSIPYGVVSSKFIQGGHMETTLATRLYRHDGDVNEIDLCNPLSNVGIIVAAIEGTASVDFGQKQPCQSVKFYTTQAIYDAMSSNSKSNIDSKLDLQIDTQTNLEAKVDVLISSIVAKSDELAAKETFSSKTLDPGNIVLGDEYANKVVYITVNLDDDTTGFKTAIQNSGGIKITKPESTVVVFNVKNGTTLDIQKYDVNGRGSDQQAWNTNGAYSEKNADTDRLICQKIIWNITDATTITTTATAGIFLVKQSTSTLKVNTSTAGWILSAGTVANTGEIHYIYQGSADPNGAPLPPTANFQFDKYDPDKICLEGAEFTLYTDAACTTPYYKAGEPYKVKSDADGVCKFTGVVEGTYYLKETETVAGFNINTNIYKVLIVGSNVKFGEGVDSTPSLTSLEVVNDPITAALEVTVIDEKTGDIVPGVKIKIKKPNGKEEDKITDSKGKVEYPKAPIGNYTITVTEVPEGYSVTVGSTLTPEVKVGDNPKKVEAKIANKNDGSNTPGGNTPGGNTPGGNTPGGNTPGGNGSNSGAGGNSIVPGGNTPGGSTNSNKSDSASVTNKKGGSVSATPAMGDSMNVTLFVGVMILAMALATGMIVLRKKED